MRKFICVYLFFCVFTQVYAQNFQFKQMTDHPRLLLKAGEESLIKEKTALSPELLKVHNWLISNADQTLDAPPAHYDKQGKRILHVSRLVLSRLFDLSYAYRMTKEMKYVNRAILEIKAVCQFKDWNPSHFLDTGEMTMALAIAYDWMFDALPADVKKMIEKSIVKKAFESAQIKENNGWYQSMANWNPVCNAGLVFGALATYESNPAYSEKIIRDCYATIPIALQEYAPDGAYPEGYVYWDYGTSFLAMLCSAMVSALGSDYGLSDYPGFKESAYYYQHMLAPSQSSYNYADSGGGGGYSSTMFYFASLWQDPSLLFYTMSDLKNAGSKIGDRLLPTVLIYAKNLNLQEVKQPTQKTWMGRGTTPVYLTRSEWGNPNATFLGVKGGTPFYSHCHMDNGSFVYEANGVRWAIDLGADGYLQIESTGLDLWNMEQESERWTLLRQNNKHHNTLTVNGKRHLVHGYGSIVSTFEDKEKRGVVVDLQKTFGDDLKGAVREFTLINEQVLEIEDRLETSSEPADIQWTMVTAASPEVVAPDKVLLRQNGKLLSLTVESPANVQLEVWTNQPEQPYETPNEGTIRIGFKVKLQPNVKENLKVRLTPL